MRQLTLKETSEASNTPIFVNNYLTHNKYHHTLKGCKTEMMLLLSDDANNNNISIVKYCKTHRKICSKSGWEVGWFLGTYSPAMDRRYKAKYTKCSCGRKFIKDGRKKLCPICRCQLIKINKHFI